MPSADMLSMLPALITGVTIILFFPLFILYLTLVERKILADMQGRLGPMRVGPHGLLQGLADALKLLLKEDIVPSGSDRTVFRFAPVMATAAALTAMAILPFSRAIFVSDLNIGLLLIVATASFGVLPLVLGGWASNSHYPLLGALRSAAQLISYEIALSFGLVCGILSAGTLRMQSIVEAQFTRHVWFAFDHWGFGLVGFGLFAVAALAESNRSPFDLPEAESELAGGYHLEYSGMRFAFFMLAEYANLFIACGVAVTVFWGGWMRPFQNVAWLELPVSYGIPFLLFWTIAGGILWLARKPDLPFFRFILVTLAVGTAVLGMVILIPTVNRAVSGIFWFLAKVLVLLYGSMWARATLPRLRYDQLMRLGWKWLIPIGIIAIAGNAILGML
jgi:NADH-quinone oxidoreductase subunit H